MKGIIVLLSFIISPALCGLLSPLDSLRLSRPVVDGGWTEWTGWTRCTRKCGGGTQSHSRRCTNPRPSGGGAPCEGERQKTQACNSHLCPIPGQWGQWSDYLDCSVTCGNGRQTRYRYCDNPVPQNGGAYCIGSNSSSSRCTNARCPAAGKILNYPLTDLRGGDIDEQQDVWSWKISDAESG